MEENRNHISVNNTLNLEKVALMRYLDDKFLLGQQK